MAETRSLTFSRTLRAAPAEIIRAFTHPTLLRDWLCNHASSDAHLGGHIFLTWNQGYQVMGRYTQLDAPHSVAFTWLGAGDPAQTQVRVTVEPAEEGLQRVNIVHAGLGEGPAWDMQAARWNKDWPDALENLQSVLETGLDLRVVRRPRLGIWMDEVTQAVADRLGLPAVTGVLIQGTAEGSGAQAAGLQKDDVLVSLNGVPLLTPASFEQALFGLKAGDNPPIEFIRGVQKQAAVLTLGSFPIPDFPDGAAALADNVRGLFAESLAQLRQHLAGLSDAEAAAQPSEGAWSVKEMVAHLVLTDRDYQNWVAGMLNDVVVEDWLQMRPNVTPRIQALTTRMPALERLLDELALTLEETAAMIAALPENFVNQRKHLYRRAAEWATQVTPTHYSQEHKEQFQAAIDAASLKQ
jgi:uncharacterized protein YndB with AHSA1/START domain